MSERTLAPRRCPSCALDHPPTRTCATGGNPWDGEPIVVTYVTAEERQPVSSRWDTNRSKGIQPGFVDREGDALTRAAEDMVAERLGVEAVGDAGGPDAGWDMTYRGQRVDVKLTKYRSGYLAVKTWKPRRANVYVLVTGNDRAHLLIRGFAWRAEVEAAPVRDEGYRNPDGSPQLVFAVPQEQLHAFSELDLLPEPEP